MFWLVVVAAVYWVGISMFAYRYLNKEMIKLESYFRKRQNVPEKYLPYYRDDFHLWDKKAIRRNCFIHLPWKFLMLLSAVMLAVVLTYIIVVIEWIIRQKRCKVLRNAFSTFMNLYGGKVVVQLLCPTKQIYLNKEPASPEPIVVSNHVCWFEILYYVCTKWPISFLCKEQIERTPLVGTVATFGDSLYVVRESEQNRGAVLQQIQERCDQVEAGELPPLLIFPEGTTTNGKYLANFKRGSFEPMSRIQIISLKYECENFNMAMDDMGQFTHVLLTLCHWPRLQIKIMNDVRPVCGTPDQYCRRVRGLMATMLGASQPDSRFRDKVEYHQMLVDEFKNQQKHE